MMSRLSRLAFTGRLRSRRGASLAEAVIAGAIISLMIGGVAGLSNASNRQYSRNSAQVGAEGDASLALQTVERDLRESIRASQATTSEITVVLPAITAEGDYDRFTEGSTVRWYRTGETLYRQVNGGSGFAVLTGVTTFQATLATSSVTLQMAVRKQTGTTKETATLQSVVRLRNQNTDL